MSQDQSAPDRQAFGFEDLNVYKAAKEFRRTMYDVAKVLPADERFALAQQIRRAAVSVTNNLAEGYGRFTWQDRTHFCRQARGSLMEFVDDISVCSEQGYIPEAQVKAMRQQAAQVLRLMNGYMVYLQQGSRKAALSQPGSRPPTNAQPDSPNT